MEGRLEFRVLGPLEVVADGRPVALGGVKQRTVLAVLLVQAGRVVSSDRLIEEVWPDQPPDSAARTLQSHVSHLRRALEPQRRRGAAFQVVVTRSPGYVLQVEPGQVDAARFEGLVQEGSAALEAGDPGVAAARLREGLTLWRGSVLAEFADAAFARGEIARLEELRLVATETRIAAGLTLGRHAELVGELEALVAAQPLREGLRAQLMLALYRSGRQADALGVYRDARALLADELGVDPGADLQRLHEAILGHKPELDWTPTPAPPKPDKALPPHEGATTLIRRPILKASSAPRAVFLGRDVEFEQLRRALADARSGLGRLVLVGGEPGIGKTSVAHELAGEAGAAGLPVLWGRVWEADGAPAFWPWVQILRSWVESCAAERLGQVLGSDAAVITQLVPQVAERLPGLVDPPCLEPAQARFRLFDAVTRVLKRVARTDPLVLVLDDLHRADESSLRLLQFLARELADARLLVIGTFRDAKADLDEVVVGVLAELGREPVTRRMRLEGLGEEHVGRFVELVTGVKVSPSLTVKLHERTGGNPLFLSQLVQPLALAEEDDLVLVRFEEELDEYVPQQVLEAVQWRLERLSEDARTVLTMASVLGREFNLDVLEPVSELDPGRLLELIEQAAEIGYIGEVPRTVDQYRFIHVLVRDALYGQLGGLRRARLHQRTGQALERLYADDLSSHLAELAHHFSQAADRAKAVVYLTRAGERAMALLAYEEAARLFGLALDQQPDQARRCELLLALADAQMKAGDATDARNTFLRAADSARTLGAPEQLARAALGFGQGLHVTFGFTKAKQRTVELLEEALGSLDTGDSPLRAQVLGRLAVALYWQPDAGRRRTSRKRSPALSQQAVEMARRLGDTSVLASVLRTRCFILLRPEALKERLALAAEILALAEAAHDQEMAQEARMWRIVGYLELGDVLTMDTELTTYVRIGAELRQPLHLYWMHIWQSAQALMAGRFDEAEQHNQQALGFGQRLEGLDTTDLQSAVGGQRCMLRKEQGRLAEMEESVRRFVREFPQVSAWRAALAIVHMQAGDEQAARREFEHLAAANFNAISQALLWLFTVALSAEVCAFLGDARRAAILYELLLPYERRCVVLGLGFSCLGSVAHFLGQLAATMGHTETACQHFAAALKVNERVGVKPYLAHTKAHYARALLARGLPGDHETADTLRGQALETARTLGMAPLTQQISSQLPTVR